MNKQTKLMSPDNAKTEQAAQRLVSAGQFENIEQAWQAAIALCHETDAYEHVPDIKENKIEVKEGAGLVETFKAAAGSDDAETQEAARAAGAQTKEEAAAAGAAHKRKTDAAAAAKKTRTPGTP